MTHHEEHDQQENFANPVDVQEFLKGIDYPIDKQTLVTVAKAEGADDSVMNTLSKLPDREYTNPIEISEAIGEMQ